MKTFDITYQLTLSEGEHIDDKIEGICLEQSVELPRAVLSKEIAEAVVGEEVSREQTGEHKYRVWIRWPLENTAGDPTQFLNLLFGNISLQPGIRIEGAEWTPLFPGLFKGPSWGIAEMRRKMEVAVRPLSCAALKPLGTSPQGLGELCYQLAAGGIDIIKDDHGLASQPYAPFQERIKACVSAVRRAAEETGHRALYYPNITSDGVGSLQNYERAAELGADGALVCPHLTGLGTMHELARADIPLPIIAHPAFSGSLVMHDDQGFSPDFLYGQLWRAFGADFSIYPNSGGRFSFTPAECLAINGSLRDEKLPFKTTFPMPGGGIGLETIPRWKETYGPDTVFLVGGSLYGHPDGLRVAARRMAEMLES